MTWKGIVGRRFSPDDFAKYVRDLTPSPSFQPAFVVIHNTEIPTLAQWHDVSGARRMLGLQTYYRDDQGWSGGPHLFVADDGIWVFTPLTVPGVHSPSWNSVAWGVELVGDYAREPFGDDVKRHAIDALATLHRFAGWDAPRLRFHREDPKTTHGHCPGPHVVKAELDAGVQVMLDLST